MMTFLLVFTVLQTAVNSDFDYSSMACFAIGLAVFLGHSPRSDCWVLDQSDQIFRSSCPIVHCASSSCVLRRASTGSGIFGATACSLYRTCRDDNSWFRFSPCGAHRLPQMPPSRNLPRSLVCERELDGACSSHASRERTGRSCGLRWSSSQQHSNAVSTHLRASTERRSFFPCFLAQALFKLRWMYLYGHFGLAPKKCLLEFLSEKFGKQGKRGFVANRTHTGSSFPLMLR